MKLKNFAQRRPMALESPFSQGTDYSDPRFTITEKRVLPAVHQSVYLSNHPSSIHPSIQPLIHPTTHLSIHSTIHYLSIYPSMHPSKHPPSIHLSNYATTHPFNHPTIHLSVHLLFQYCWPCSTVPIATRAEQYIIFNMNPGVPRLPSSSTISFNSDDDENS